MRNLSDRTQEIKDILNKLRSSGEATFGKKFLNTVSVNGGTTKQEEKKYWSFNKKDLVAGTSHLLDSIDEIKDKNSRIDKIKTEIAAAITAAEKAKLEKKLAPLQKAKDAVDKFEEIFTHNLEIYLKQGSNRQKFANAFWTGSATQNAGYFTILNTTASNAKKAQEIVKYMKQSDADLFDTLRHNAAWEYVLLNNDKIDTQNILKRDAEMSDTTPERRFGKILGTLIFKAIVIPYFESNGIDYDKKKIIAHAATERSNVVPIQG